MEAEIVRLRIGSVRSALWCYLLTVSSEDTSTKVRDVIGHLAELDEALRKENRNGCNRAGGDPA